MIGQILSCYSIVGRLGEGGVGALLAGAAVLVCGMISAGPAVADCPSSSVSEVLADLPLAEAYRTRVMGLEPPLELYSRALVKPGEVFIQRDGTIGQAVLVAPVAVEDFWRALNDDDHHDDGGYLPLRQSAVIVGDSAAPGRETFQYFKRAGLGRWWVNLMEMNGDLYETTDGRMWELTWHDVLEKYPDETPPVEIGTSVRKVAETLGGWMLVPLSNDCVLVEYTSGGDPGGFVGALQFLVATRAVRTTLLGMLSMAREHANKDHSGVRFVRPDGTSLIEDPGE